MSLRDHQKEKRRSTGQHFPVSYILGMSLILFFLTRIVFQSSAARHFPPQVIAVQGVASWYEPKGRWAGSDSVCASRTYPRGTFVIVTNLANQKQAICRVIEYGPSAKFGRIIDLSESAFKEIADTKDGKIQVSVKKI